MMQGNLYDGMLIKKKVGWRINILIDFNFIKLNYNFIFEMGIQLI